MIPERPVGGSVLSINKVAVLMPYLVLTSLVGVVAAAISIKQNGKNKRRAL
jgi:hypothetical protein